MWLPDFKIIPKVVVPILTLEVLGICYLLCGCFIMLYMPGSAFTKLPAI